MLVPFCRDAACCVSRQTFPPVETGHAPSPGTRCCHGDAARCVSTDALVAVETRHAASLQVRMSNPNTVLFTGTTTRFLQKATPKGTVLQRATGVPAQKMIFQTTLIHSILQNIFKEKQKNILPFRKMFVLLHSLLKGKSNLGTRGNGPVVQFG